MEIEHKYLVIGEGFRQLATAVHHIEQGYLSLHPTVRVRIRDQEGFITIKGPSSLNGLMRQEYEYPIPLEDAQALMRLCGSRTISKDRYIVPYEGHTWEVDVFLGRHAGQLLAELEVASPEQTFALPDWVGSEVTGQVEYYNAHMALNHQSQDII